jgi:hypothetical protein
MNRLQEPFEEGAGRPAAGDYFVVAADCCTWCVSTTMARSIEQSLDGRPRPKWVTFVDLTGARIRLRARQIEYIGQCPPSSVRRSARSSGRSTRSGGPIVHGTTMTDGAGPGGSGLASADAQALSYPPQLFDMETVAQAVEQRTCLCQSLARYGPQAEAYRIRRSLVRVQPVSRYSHWGQSRSPSSRLARHRAEDRGLSGVSGFDSRPSY